MPYTIVFTPQDGASKYVDASQELKRFQSSYVLTADGTSSPHVTVVQFDCDSETAGQIWVRLCSKMEAGLFEPFTPPFTGVSFIEGVGPYEGSTWVELSIARGNATSPIMKVHTAALEALESFHVNPLNAFGNNYRPHLTLARIVMPKEIPIWNQSILKNVAPFKLEFGLSDQKWQFAQSLAVLKLNS